MRNIFLECGHTTEEIEAKLDTAFHSLFEGDKDNERVCFTVNDELAYIEDIGHSDIRSEGMSYGMTIAAVLGKRDLFDKLWNFSKRYLLNKEGPWKGYYSWQVSTKDFSMMDPGSAPDGEEYFAAALLIAAKKFNEPSYKKEGIEIINAMAYKEKCEYVHTMFDHEKMLTRFSPNDGNDFTDPSYNTIAFYRFYARETGDDFWNKVAASSFKYLQKAVHPVTGLSAEYSEYDGTPRATPWYPTSDCFCGDAWRVAWNLALDASTLDAYYGKDGLSVELAEVKAWERGAVKRLFNFLDARRPYKADYRIDGSAFPTEPREATVGLIGMNGAATLALEEGDPQIKAFADDLWNLQPPTGTWRYYDGMLYMLGLLACSGKFEL